MGTASEYSTVNAAQGIGLLERWAVKFMISMDYSPIIIVPWKKWAVEAIIAYVYSLFPSKIKRI